MKTSCRLLRLLHLLFVPVPALCLTPRAAAVNAGETVYFRSAWQGPAPSNPAVPSSWDQITVKDNFPLNGVLIRATDAGDAANFVDAIIVDGVAAFPAPAEFFLIEIFAQFRGFTSTTASAVVNEADEPGYGLVNLRDAGTGNALRFVIFNGEQWVNTVPDAPLPRFVFNGQFVSGGVEWVENMSALHGLAAAAGEFMRRTGHGFDISSLTFADMGAGSGHSRYAPSTQRLVVRRGEAFLWDRLSIAAVQAVLSNELLATAIDAPPSPDGNQYDYFPPDTTVPPVTYQNAALARQAAFYHGLSMAVGVMLTESNPRWAGKLWGMGDRKIAGESPEMEANALASRGEDSPRAIAGMIWDLCDTAGDSFDVAGVSLKDRSRVDLKRIFRTGNPEYAHIGDFWNVLSELAAAGVLADSFDGLYDKLGESEVAARWGIAPVLTGPAAGTLLTLDPQATPRLKFKWRQTDTGPEALRQNQFALVLLNAAMDARLWSKGWFSRSSAASHEYELSLEEMTQLNAAVLASGAESGVLLVLAKSPGLGGGTAGPLTMSNKVRVNLKPVMRTNVIAVDTSWSSPWRDPSRSRLIAAADYASQFVPAVTLEDGTKVLQDQIGVLSFASAVGLVSDWADPDKAVEALHTAMPGDGGYTDFISAFDTGLEMLSSVKPPVPSVNNSAVEVKKTITILTDGDYYVPGWYVWADGDAAWQRLLDSGHEILEVAFWSSDGHPPVSVAGNRNAAGPEPAPKRGPRRPRGVRGNVEVNGHHTWIYIRDRQLPRLLEYVPPHFLPFGQRADGDGNPLPDDNGDFAGTPDMTPAGTTFYAAAGTEQEVKLERPAIWDTVNNVQLAIHFSPRAIIQGPDGSFITGISLESDSGEDFETVTFTAPLDGEYSVIVSADPKSTEPGLWNLKVPLTRAPASVALPTVFEASRSRRWADGRVSMTFTVPPHEDFAPFLRLRYSDDGSTWQEVPEDLLSVNAAGYAQWTDRTAPQAARRFYKAERVPAQ